MIERLVGLYCLDEGLVQVADEFDRVSHLQVGMATEEVADGDIGRAPDRMTYLSHQFLVEKQAGTLVWEDHSHMTEVGAIFLEDILCYVFEK